MNKQDDKKVKLRIHLSTYNNLPYDFIEVMTPISEIQSVYNALKEHVKGPNKQKSYVPNTFTPQAPKQDWNKPSPAQVSFARKLGITNPSGMTKQEVSEAINRKLGK